MRRGLELADAATAVELPTKSLRAVEWDRLDLLGNSRDADRVLRAYASFLEVDLGGTADDGAAPKDVRQKPQPARRPARLRSILLWIVVGAPLVVALAYFVATALREAGDDNLSAGQATRVEAAAPATTPDASPRPQADRKQRPKPRPPVRPPVRLALSAERGSSWIEARVSSATGALLFQGTLADGRRITLYGRRLWVRFGAASNVSLTLNGKPAGRGLQGTVATLVTPHGIRPA